ncbi:GTPase HflX [Candidatus Oleimmundimicrobium sp.]|uniref:GTPase HflX n=1 Tax=Candidatus Oleimmundimicrobium sp. TaxID=3060597 RepID=UPI002716CBDC|nr:GTPase HflX [Candidatus Oleimmundimicrobium sp.]MDO8885404.1 GTPase HflX [Candidatus Oleimmundimicrobium sp.]
MKSFNGAQQTLKEKVILVTLQQPSQKIWEIEDSIRELEQLSATARAKVVGKLIQQREKPHPKTYIGIGKAKEIANLSKKLGATSIIFNNNLTPSQQGNLEEIINLKIIDRTALILDIFARHAHSNEGKLQVELAQLNYRLPRLKGKGMELSRLGGGIGTRGPGETKLEVDRRKINQRIQHLKKELEELDKRRSLQRKQRKKNQIFLISIVGYTNAGKSTLLNVLTSADVLVKDRLFATLDSTSRKLILPSKQKVVISDTVGFISNLPNQLIASFKSTLDEIRETDLILHVINLSSPMMEEQIAAVENILSDIGATGKPQINVFNKIDAINERLLKRIKRKFPDALYISALKNLNIEILLKKIDEIITQNAVKITLKIPYNENKIFQKVYQLGRVISKKKFSDGNILVIEIPEIYLLGFKKFLRENKNIEQII